MDTEPEVKEVIKRLKDNWNTTCTDDLIEILGNREAKHYDLSSFEPKLSHKEKIRILGRDALIRRLRDDGVYVWIRFSSDGIPVIELDKILLDSREYGEKVSALHE